MMVVGQGSGQLVMLSVPLPSQTAGRTGAYSSLYYPPAKRHTVPTV